MIYNASAGVEKENFQAEAVEDKDVLQLLEIEKIEIECIKEEIEGRVVGANHVEEEVINQLLVQKSSRRGVRNWSPSYIVRVFDWCISRQNELGIGKRGLSRLAADY